MKRRKTHHFRDCTAVPTSEECGLRLTPIRATTCWACKGRILEPIRAADWSKLDPATLRVLEQWRGCPLAPLATQLPRF